jgi:hypothetical protein
MPRRFLWQVVDDSAEPVAQLGEAVEYVEQPPRPGELALVELHPAGVSAVGEFLVAEDDGFVLRDLFTGEKRVFESDAVQRVSRIVGTRTRGGEFVRRARGWPV